MDGLFPYNGKVTLTFKESNDGKGYMITGTTSTSNDYFDHAVIEEGYVSFDGKEAWWRLHRSVNVNMKVLNEGSFNFKTNTFVGKWVSLFGTKGHFTRFSLKGSASASDAHGNGQTHTQAQAPEGAPDKEAEQCADHPSAPPVPSTYTVDIDKPREVQPSAPPAPSTYTVEKYNSYETRGMVPMLLPAQAPHKDTSTNMEIHGSITEKMMMLTICSDHTITNIFGMTMMMMVLNFNVVANVPIVENMHTEHPITHRNNIINTVTHYKPGEVQPSAPTATTANNGSIGAAPSMFDKMMRGL